MLVSLKITPVLCDLTRLVMKLAVGTATGVYETTVAEYREVCEEGRTLVVRLQEPPPPMPSPKRVKRASMKQEERVASDLGGHRHKGSGALAGLKGDGRVKGKYRIENKMCFSKGIRVSREDLNKIRGECSLGEVPIFQIEFAERSTCKVDDQWVLVPYEHWKSVNNAKPAPDDK